MDTNQQTAGRPEPARPDMFVLYQIGTSEDYTWYSVIAVFFSQSALEDYAQMKGISAELQTMRPDNKGDVVLREPVQYVAVPCSEGEVPDVELLGVGEDAGETGVGD